MAGTNGAKGDVAALERIAANYKQQIEHGIKRHVKQTKGENALLKEFDPIQQQLAKMGKHVVSILKGTEQIAEKHNPIEFINHIDKLMMDTWEHLPKVFNFKHLNFEGPPEALGHPIIESLLGGSMGINLDAGDDKSKAAVKTIYRVTGFVIMFRFAVTGFAGALKMLLKEACPEFVLEGIGGLGEELGLNWMLGQLLETAFEHSIGTPFEEVINEQMRPSRLEWPQLRAAGYADAGCGCDRRG